MVTIFMFLAVTTQTLPLSLKTDVKQWHLIVGPIKLCILIPIIYMYESSALSMNIFPLFLIYYVSRC